MKILAFSDLHANLTAMKRLEQTIKKEHPDLLINLGDFTVFEQHIEDVCKRLAKLHKSQLVLHGNHEEESTVAALAKRHGWTFCHKRTVRFGDVLFVGHGGGGFSFTEPDFARWIKTVPAAKLAKKVVLLTHQPPYGTVLDHIWGDHVGNKSYSDFIKQRKNVVLALSGHIHETAGKTGTVNKAKLVNPGPFGKVINL
ncbi:metallophosphoesterase [Candidatus Woesearchaeota archaeon]|nr:metallophosphoesterase [Candidatus Woesearchaeota archaeon]